MKPCGAAAAAWPSRRRRGRRDRRARQAHAARGEGERFRSAWELLKVGRRCGLSVPHAAAVVEHGRRRGTASFCAGASRRAGVVDPRVRQRRGHQPTSPARAPGWPASRHRPGPKNLSNASTNTASRLAGLGKRVRHDRNFRASISPRIWRVHSCPRSSSPRTRESGRRAADVRGTPGPPATGSRSGRTSAHTEARHLRQDVPAPVRALAARAQLGECLVIARFLRFDETIQLERIARRLRSESSHASLAVASHDCAP